MSKVKEGNYIVIQSFMINDLHLKGNELLVYAIIYGFTQDENNRFTGSLQYLADWTNSTKQGVLKNLKSLQNKGLIAKNENYFNGIKIVEYYTTKFNVVLNKVEQGIKQSLPNNIEYNDNSNKDNIGKGNRPSLEELTAYIKAENLNVNPQQFIDYYDSNGWKVGKNPMKDWKATARNWSRREGNKKPNGRLPIEASFDVNEIQEKSMLDFIEQARLKLKNRLEMFGGLSEKDIKQVVEEFLLSKDEIEILKNEFI